MTEATDVENNTSHIAESNNLHIASLMLVVQNWSVRTHIFVPKNVFHRTQKLFDKNENATVHFNLINLQ